MLNKISVIGGGNIGGVLVQELVSRKLARTVALVDIKEHSVSYLNLSMLLNNLQEFLVLWLILKSPIWQKENALMYPKDLR